MSICFIDLDGLKHVNDTFGHEMGDSMIIATGNIIQASIRKSDIICRWGGDEFVLLMHCDMQQAENLMKRIQSNMDEKNRQQQTPYQLGFSYGIVSVDENPDKSMDDLISIADSRMYKQKLEKQAARCTSNCTIAPGV
jgi:diguanylate cyclase (GGDEF)-like protein